MYPYIADAEGVWAKRQRSIGLLLRRVWVHWYSGWPRQLGQE